jgi:hypothetical protein
VYQPGPRVPSPRKTYAPCCCVGTGESFAGDILRVESGRLLLLSEHPRDPLRYLATRTAKSSVAASQNKPEHVRVFPCSPFKLAEACLDAVAFVLLARCPIAWGQRRASLVRHCARLVDLVWGAPGSFSAFPKRRVICAISLAILLGPSSSPQFLRL